jgi:hypothetical protein
MRRNFGMAPVALRRRRIFVRVDPFLGKGPWINRHIRYMDLLQTGEPISNGARGQLLIKFRSRATH